MGVLFVCTGNRCRSPMAAGLLQARLAADAIELPVGSAGFLAAGAPPPAEVIAAMDKVGVDLRDHLSRRLSRRMLAAAELTITMTRQHLVDLTALEPDGWSRRFTFADLLHRAETVGRRRQGEPLAAWAERLHGQRMRSSILSLPLDDDIRDPMGGRPKDYETTRDALAAMTASLVNVLVPA